MNRSLRRSRPHSGSQCGFMLVEVLVTILIVVLALMGALSMSLTALRQSKSGQLRSQAVFLVSDLAERMEANKQGAVAGYYASSSGSSPQCPAGNATCTQAAADMQQWKSLVSDSLPQSSISVAVDSASLANRPVYTIILRWVDRESNSKYEAATSASAPVGRAVGGGEAFSYVAQRTIFQQP